ncbi:arginase family protein [Rhizobium hainanense]|uniref:Arginase n=1 Tax=Rhizobium hainanense TaxID=52131 RepID=A0A1C3W8Q3_9HYPH|nr:arginase family protein [Rhizobium hainanense]SCB36522.1 arginase [Rhizobium hainanense]
MPNESLRNIPISLIGLPYMEGTRQPNAGYSFALGPTVLLEATNVPAAMREVFDDIEVIMIDDVDEPGPRETGGDHRLLPIGDQMSRILVQNIRLAQVVSEARAKGRIPITAIGCCSAALGMVGGVGDAEGDIGMIWFDCHGDAKTPDTSENGFFDGMPVTTIAGKCWPRLRRKIPGFKEIPEDRIVTIGLHEQFTSGGRPGAGDALGWQVHKLEFEKHGFEGALALALDDLLKRCKKVFVHVDVDVLDPSIINVSTHTAPGGFTSEQLVTALDMIGKRFEILALAWSAYDPTIDTKGPSVLIPMVVQSAQIAARSRLPG